MSLLAPTLQAFFTDRLINQRKASPHTIAAYRNTLPMPLAFAAQHTAKQPSPLEIDDLDGALIGAFLDHLEHDRANSVRTRNTRLAAIRSLFKYAALKHPEHANTIQRVLAIPAKRLDQALITFLTDPESTRCSPRPTDRPRSVAVITPSSCSPRRPACASRS